MTDAWAQAVRARAREVGSAFPAQTRTDAAAVMTRITDLPDLRGYAIGSDAPALAVVTEYALATGDLFTFDDDIAQQAGSSVLVGSVRALGSLSRMKDQASQQRAILQAALLEGRLEPGALDAIIAAQAQQATDLASFETSATLGETQILVNYAHFKKDRDRGDTRLGWGRMTLIHDMAQVLPSPGPEDAELLLTAWRENVDTLEESSESMIKITDEIQRLRLTTIDILNHLR